MNLSYCEKEMLPPSLQKTSPAFEAVRVSPDQTDQLGV